MPETYTWNSAKRRFVDADGKTVPIGTVRSWIDDFAVSIAVLFAERAGRVVSEAEINIDDLTAWYTVTQRELEDGHRAATVIAYGGLSQMTDSEWQEAEGAIREQMGFWEAFAAGVFVGTIPIDGRFPARTAMYGDAIYGTYENNVRRREAQAGMDEERRVLGAADHCEDCVLAASLGWRSIGTLPAIGDSACKSRCKCHFEYRIRPTS